MNDTPIPLRDLSTLSADDFRPHIDSIFRVCFSEADRANTPVPETSPLTLREVQALPAVSSPPGNARAGFSLIFAGAWIGPRRGYLPQRIYRLEHDTLGAMDVFLVPVGPTPNQDAMTYQAVFS